MLTLGFPTAPLFTKSILSPFEYKPTFSLIPGNGALIISKRNANLPCVSLPKSRKMVVASAVSNAGAAEYGGVEVVEKNLEIPAGSNRPQMPKHVALLTDGHRRWAEQKGLPFELGYWAARKPVLELTRVCFLCGVKVLSVFAHNYLNEMLRPEVQNDLAKHMIEGAMRSDVENLMIGGIRVSVVGDRTKMPENLQEMCVKIEETTKANTNLHVLLATCYDGRSDITQACTSLSTKVKDGLIKPDDITETLFEQELYTKGIEYPNPDLFIRTGAKRRIGNYMLWQMAYTEFFFIDKLAPDCREEDFMEAFRSFGRRKRRIGS